MSTNELAGIQPLSQDRPISGWAVGLLMSLVLSALSVLTAAGIDIAFDLGMLSDQSRLWNWEGPVFLLGLLLLVFAGHCGDRLEQEDRK